MRNDPDHKQVLEYFCRHLVAICITYRFKHEPVENPNRVAVFSGTIFCVDDVYCVLTAGHCIGVIEELFGSDEIEITGTVLADTFGYKRISDIPIPFDIRAASPFHIDSKELGLDFGLIRLHPHYVRLLSKNGTVAIFEENWTHQHKQDLNVFFIVGFPDELSGPTIVDGAAHVTPSLLRVVPTEQPANATRTAYDRFVAKIDGDIGVRNIKGMSGGPILGFNIQNPNVYWVVAIQSTWLPSQGIVYGCPLPTIGGLLKDWTSRPAEASEA